MLPLGLQRLGLPREGRRFSRFVRQCMMTEVTDENGHDVHNNGSNPIIMIVHSDDVGCYSEFDEERAFIAKEFDNRFGVVMADPRYMLGVLREVIDLDGSHRMLKLSTATTDQW